MHLCLRTTACSGGGLHAATGTTGSRDRPRPGSIRLRAAGAQLGEHIGVEVSGGLRGIPATIGASTEAVPGPKRLKWLGSNPGRCAILMNIEKMRSCKMLDITYIRAK